MKQVFMRKNPLRRANIVAEEVPAPRCGASHVLLANAYSLISAGTETASVKRNMKDMVVKAMTTPDLRDSVKEMLLKDGLAKTADRVHYETTKWTPMGYSGAGVAIEVGQQISGIQVGDLVAYGGEGHAEIIRAGRNLAVRVPEGVSAREASFVALGSIAMQGVRRAEVSVGDVVVVLGLGLVGQLVCQMLRAAGARVIGVDLMAARCELALKLGAELVLPAGDQVPQEVFRYTGGVGADRVMVCAATSSSAVVEQAVAACRDRGRITVVGMVGMDIPQEPFYRKELDFVISRSYGPGRYDPRYEQHGIDYPISYVRWTEQRNMQEFLRLVQAGRVQVAPLITHEFGLDEAGRAYEMLAEQAGQCLGIVLRYGEPPATIARRVPIAAQPAPVRRGGKSTGVAVVGCGAFARQFHLPNLKASPQLHLRAMVASSGQSAKEMGARYGAEYCTTDLDEALRDPDIGATLIFTRDHAHARMALASLRAGKHAFCEKPLATTYDDCRAIEAQLADGGPICMTGFNRRFAPLMRRAKQLLAGRSGPGVFTYRVNAGSLPKDYWIFDPQQAAGRIVGEGCHFVDLLCWLVGAEPVSVSAQAVGPVTSLAGLEDVMSTITFADGSVGTLLYTARGTTKLGKERLEVFWDGNALAMDDYRQLTARGRATVDEQDRVGDKGHAAELAHFASAVRGECPPEINYVDGILATVLCLKIYESAVAGCPLPVTWDDASTPATPTES